MLKNLFEQFKRIHDEIIESEDLDLNHAYFRSKLFDLTKEAYYSQIGDLPRLDLPDFDGSCANWESFRDLFKALVHNREEYPPVVKFQHLRTHVKGDALDLIKNISIVEGNYIRAWNTLLEHYNKVKRLNKEVFGAVDALSALRRDLGNGDVIVALAVSKLNSSLHKEWFKHIGSVAEPPTLDQLRYFFHNQIQTLESYQDRSFDREPKSTFKSKYSSHATVNNEVVKNKKPCPVCEDIHPLWNCDTFRSMTWLEKREILQIHRHCFNCLGSHWIKDCGSTQTCQKCQQKHHTLLHKEQEESTKSKRDKGISGKKASLAITAVKESESSSDEISCNNCVNSSFFKTPTGVLLATALVNIHNSLGECFQVRALIDQCSQCSVISQSLCSLLGLRGFKINVSLTGVGSQTSSNSKRKVSLVLGSTVDPKFKLEIEALVLPRVTSYQPPYLSNDKIVEHLHQLVLADPQFTKTRKIYLLLGSTVHTVIIKGEVFKGNSFQPIASDTQLGWIVSGPVETTTKNSKNVSHSLKCSEDDKVLEVLKRFWQVEEPFTSVLPLWPEEIQCEQHFVEHHARNSSGRYVVRYPFKDQPPEVIKETSFKAAQAMLKSMETKLSKNHKFRELYVQFMEEYLESGHMVEGSFEKAKCFLPHHGVIKESSSTTKLRVVFNGSSRSSLCPSLNEYLHIGPNLLVNLADLIADWRNYRYVFTADIAKMFRQVSVHPNDQLYQAILWRDNQSKPLRVYFLTTVAYGLASSPYLASRTLSQLALDCKNEYPLASETLLKSKYMDDILSGGHSLVESIQRRDELLKLTESGGFPLRKWSANSPKLLDDLPPSLLASSLLEFKDSAMSTLVLGLSWNPLLDLFQFKVLIETEVPVDNWTKRKILSEISKLYDPLGWLAPTVISAKAFMQSLWLLKLSWDEPIQELIVQDWLAWYKELPALNKVKILRWNGVTDNMVKWKLHCFADASKTAYAAVMYSRVVNNNGEVIVALLLSKTKVALLKTLSIPRLELCAAHLAAKLVNHYLNNNTRVPDSVHLWSDSKDVLYWLQDIPSRYSTLKKLLAVSAYVLRFVFKCRVKAQMTKLNVSMYPYDQVNKLSKLKFLDISAHFQSSTKILDTKEINNPTLFWVSYHQGLHFPIELRLLNSKESKLFVEEISLPSNSRIASLKPVLSKGLLRVGGRLAASILDDQIKNPLILAQHDYFTNLIIRSIHEVTLHGGVQLTLTTLRAKYWIINGRQCVRSCVNRCLKCRRVQASNLTQQMGDLPAERVRPAPAFSKVGVDYAGPFAIRLSKTRGRGTTKGYIAVFICLSSKALHLEVVEDYTAESFVAAFQRMTARRGHCSDLFSNCGTNFVKAAKELDLALKNLLKESELAQSLVSLGTNWHFNPPHAPHFGGIWEAAVKSVKFHLKRIVGEQIFTFVEFCTLLCKIEACLNSRPLLPLTLDVTDSFPLTPAHLLIMRPTFLLPEVDTTSERVPTLHKWKLISQLAQSFWKRWSTEYLQSLQTRKKWPHERPSVQVGDLVLIKDSQFPPGQWPLALIIKTYSGPDGLIRVVKLRTANSTFTRPIVKLVLLLTRKQLRDNKLKCDENYGSV
ncbi:uncharacterized protein LOC106645067 [Copidosoma floridanum]|uniref:uncharacterized protein LOC106645067 n=1 Tax=Copidosoma floridanum TaxID=29053 RepID=UPI0006C99D4D|nr:uncharacterized protein LOC106645067 [Copidosoma floridanum]